MLWPSNQKEFDMNRKFILSIAAAGALMGLGSAAQARPAVVAIDMAPPAPMHEIIPAPRHGYVWAPGHYDWRHGQYVWISGRWMSERPGYVWQEARWVQRPDGSWFMVGGDWVRTDRYSYGYGRDRDRDGVPNRFDRDRDGDGLPNWRDDHPNNPYRD
jgi:hypothetical protein